MRQPSGVIEFRDLHAYVVCFEMRVNEQAQNLAFNGLVEYDHEIAARAIISRAGPKYTLCDESGKPVLIGGFNSTSEGCWQSWQTGTDEAWSKHWRSATKASRWLLDELFQHGARRVSDTPLMSRTQAIEWIRRSMGFRLEGIMRQFGANGEDVGLFAITANDYFQSHKRREEKDHGIKQLE
jgi:hypothetical protein